ncbi:hypothetical protein IPM09_03745 [Candidatus Saccharibacteria bacterium]|nr:MAG: hypothetical protein IPM09_03745 [Candidatus Saccharibacteria bacterium]
MGMQVAGHHVLAQVREVPSFEQVQAAVDTGAAVALGIACYCDCVESYATIELHNLRDTYEADSGYSFTGNYLSAAVHDGCDANVVGLLTAERGVCRVVVHTDTSSVDIDFHVYMSFVIVE